MRKNTRLLLCALTALLLFSSCAWQPAAAPAETAETAVQATIPAPGNPEDVTCQGSYTDQAFEPDTEVASVGKIPLTNGQLQVWYAMTVAAYRQNPQQDAVPDFNADLASQSCPIDDTVNSWQQYFLKHALIIWHNAQALALQAEEVPFLTELAYEPNLKNHETYMTGMPATEYLYGYNTLYKPNSIHQAYLDCLPQVLEEAAAEEGFSGCATLAEAMGTTEARLLEAAKLYNFAYMYFTQLSYGTEATDEQVQVELARTGTQGEKTVSIRHILFATREELDRDREEVEKQAEKLLKSWQKMYRRSEGAFADLAYRNSLDTATARDGGAYYHVRKGQLPQVLEDWCFDDSRQPEDTVILHSDLGLHILYFSGSSSTAAREMADAITREHQQQMIRDARIKYPVQIDYAAITLSNMQSSIPFSRILYPDLAHERFPEIPLYLQQDYGNTMYGGHLLRTNGCGITSLAMLATYMADTELTPPEMCERYGRYSHSNGTDGMIFAYEPPVLGFFLREKTYEPPVAKAALAEGQVVISVQHSGYWTRGGHYIVLEKLNEDGTVQVRDSNIYNYQRIASHAQDSHTWGSITGSGSGYWIFEDKITTIPGCSRCGDPESILPDLFTGDFHCRKCAPALLRRDTFLSVSPE